MIYSIGYSTYKFNSFLSILKKHRIDCLVDVRSLPYSKSFPDYNREVLCKALEDNGIQYCDFSLEFGARQESPDFYTKDMILDFEKYISSEQFQAGVARLLGIHAQGKNIALMCAERNPLDCHRAIMISRGLKQNATMIYHIVGKDVVPHSDLEKQLVELYFPKAAETTSINSDNWKKLLQEAYRKRNLRIGYFNPI